MPYILSFLRLVLALTGKCIAQDYPAVALSIWLLGGFLGVFSSPESVKSVQADRMSNFSVFMDICSDNLLRSAGWVSASKAHRCYGLVAGPILFLEWGTTLSTQIHILCDYPQWKMSRKQDPLWIQHLLREQDKSVLGKLSLYGLFATDLVVFAAARGMASHIPYFWYLFIGAIIGRFVVAMVEIWLCICFFTWFLQRLCDKGDLWLQSTMEMVCKQFSLLRVKRL